MHSEMIANATPDTRVATKPMTTATAMVAISAASSASRKSGFASRAK
jgi:hypothetical protein